jgi:hypothetical protein
MSYNTIMIAADTFGMLGVPCSYFLRKDSRLPRFSQEQPVITFATGGCCSPLPEQALLSRLCYKTYVPESP